MIRVNKNKVVGEVVKDYALELLEEENYDLKDDFSDEEIAGAVSNLAMALVGRNAEGELVVKTATVSLFALGLSWRAQSGHPRSWVSVSGDHCTGVSRSEIPIFSNPHMIDRDEVQYLVEMMNEAWFLMREKQERL